MVDYQRYLININFVGRMDILSIRAEGFGSRGVGVESIKECQKYTYNHRVLNIF